MENKQLFYVHRFYFTAEMSYLPQSIKEIPLFCFNLLFHFDSLTITKDHMITGVVYDIDQKIPIKRCA